MKHTHTHTHKDKRVTVALRGSKDMSDLEIAITPRLFAAKSQHLAAPVLRQSLYSGTGKA